jgi:hypothetical protein
VKIRDYYFGQPVTLRSPLPADEVRNRIGGAIRCPWYERPFRTGPAGGIRFGQIRLRYQSSVFEYNAKPLLTGPIEPTPTGSVLRLVYRGRTWSRAFYIFWYAFLTLFVIAFATTGTDQPLHGAERLAPFAILGVLAIFPFVMHAIGTSRSDEELRELLEFLEQVAQARP